MQPKLQILGGTALIDCEGITMKHFRQLSPAIALQAMNVMGVSSVIQCFFFISILVSNKVRKIETVDCAFRLIKLELALVTFKRS